MEIRKMDKWGSGEFGASRGSRKHNGIDIVGAVGETVLARTGGKVTKIGYPYGDDLKYRYVEITDNASARWRHFYVEPCVKLGDTVEAYDKIGTLQCLGTRYKDITEHMHFEIILADGTYLDPTFLTMD